MIERPEHWNIPITEIDRVWFREIIEALVSQTITEDTIQLAMELAFKRGFREGMK